MTPSRGLTLASNVGTVANTTPVLWEGGRAALVVAGTTFPTALNFQMQLPNGAWLNLNGATIAANGLTMYDCPAGQYRLGMSGGTVAGLFVSLVSCPVA